VLSLFTNKTHEKGEKKGQGGTKKTSSGNVQEKPNADFSKKKTNTQKKRKEKKVLSPTY